MVFRDAIGQKISHTNCKVHIGRFHLVACIHGHCSEPQAVGTISFPGIYLLPVRKFCGCYQTEQVSERDKVKPATLLMTVGAHACGISTMHTFGGRDRSSL